MNLKSISSAVILCTALICFTGCGKSTVDLNDYVTVEFYGYDGAGQSKYSFDAERMVEENSKAFGFKSKNVDSYDDKTKRVYNNIVRDVKRDVALDINPGKNLSNGDKVTITWKKTPESLSERYKIEFTCSDIQEKVSNLEQLEKYDPFDGLEITFDGMGPDGTASLKIPKRDLNIKYEADKCENLNNGDVITVTASSYDYDDVNEYALSKGYTLTTTEKQFTVEGLSSYIGSMDAIPPDMLEKIKSQAEDSIVSSIVSSNSNRESLESVSCLGSYFLVRKEGFKTPAHNAIYMVFEVKQKVQGYLKTETKEDMKEYDITFYTYVGYPDLILLNDGTWSVDLNRAEYCKDKVACNCGYDSWGWTPYLYYGYANLDLVFDKCVTIYMEGYNYESSVKEN